MHFFFTRAMRPAHLLLYYFITLMAECRHNSRHYLHTVLISHQSVVSDKRKYNNTKQVLHQKTHRLATGDILGGTVRKTYC
jgi:hypothetical protein